MSTRARILSDDLLRPIFLARILLYSFGVLIGVILLLSGEDDPLLVAMAVIGVAVAYYQYRDISVPLAWVFDMVFAIGIALLSESPIGLATVVGWSAVIGLVDIENRWFYPTGSGIAAALSTALIEPGGFDGSIPAILRVAGVTAVTIFFVYVFRKVGELLRQNEEELRAFFDRVPVALVRTNPAGELLEYNRATAQMFDKPVIGENVTERYVDESQRASFVEKLIRDRVVINHEVTFRTGPDETIEAVVAANAIDDETGSLRYIESVINDFTSLRKTEVEREQLARVIDSTSDLVALGNWDGTLRYANAAAREWMRRYITDDEYVHLGQPIQRDDFVTIRKALQDGESWSGLITVPGRDGARMVRAGLQVLETAGDYTVASISRDVTDEVETERQLKALVRAKDELVASISHEIRTPLSVVLGIASELRDNYMDFDSEIHQEFAALIAEQGQEMANIVEDLLVAARADTGAIVLVPGLVDLGEESEATLRSLPEQERPGSLANLAADVCWGDASRVRQILRNLIVNALRYGGENITVSTETDGGVVRLYVRDDGPGVPAGEVAAIFEPFARAHAASTQPASIGLGLSVSRDLARRMDGDLEYSRVDGHTVFILTLPAPEPEV